jgi:hypothetical protein
MTGQPTWSVTEMLRPRSVFAAIALALLVCGSALAVARAQGTASTVVRVSVTDSAGAPAAGADVSVIKNLNDIVARGTTDDAGRSVLSVKHDAGNYQVVVRKIGYRRADRFFPASGRDSAVFAVTLSRLPLTLPEVKVTAQEDAKRKSYHIDAEEIANSDRPLQDALDVVVKLRPDMVWGRRGPPQNVASSTPFTGPCETPAQYKARQRAAVGMGQRIGPEILCRKPHTLGVADCPPLTNVFVNGQRIALPSVNAAGLARRVESALTGEINVGVIDVLSMIHPEHVAEVTFVECRDLSVDAPRGDNAVFVVLKPGIGYSDGIGTYLVGAPATSASGTRSADLVTEPPARPFYRAATVPAYRSRLLGVFDDLSGEVIEGADVVDVLSGLRARTSSTGTVSLIFLPEGEVLVRVEKAGYEAKTLRVAISPKDTVPITLTLDRRK